MKLFGAVAGKTCEIWDAINKVTSERDGVEINKLKKDLSVVITVGILWRIFPEIVSGEGNTKKTLLTLGNHRLCNPSSMQENKEKINIFQKSRNYFKEYGFINKKKRGERIIEIKKKRLYIQL